MRGRTYRGNVFTAKDAKDAKDDDMAACFEGPGSNRPLVYTRGP